MTMDLTALSDELRRRGSRWADMVAAGPEVGLPLGPLRFIDVGITDGDVANLPQVPDIEEVRNAWWESTCSAPGEEVVFFPGGIVRPLAFSHGTWRLYVWLLGRPDRNIMPSEPDLVNFLAMVGPAMARLGVPPTYGILAFPPILEVRLGRGTLDFHVGDASRGITFDDRDMARFRELARDLNVPPDLKVGFFRDGG